MKMLRQAVVDARNANLIIALEERINEVKTLTATIPEYQELSQNLSLESVMNHIKQGNTDIPEEIQRFSLRDLSMENETLIFAGVIAIIAAIAALIVRFTNWLSGGRSSSGGGGGGGSSGGSSFRTTPYSSSDYVSEARDRQKRADAIRKALDAYNEALRKASAEINDAARRKEQAERHKKNSTWGNRSGGGKTVRTVDEVLAVWIKDPDNKESLLAKFLNNTEPMYQEISERGDYYKLMVAQQRMNAQIAKLIGDWPDRLSRATSIVTMASEKGTTENDMMKYEDQMAKLHVGVIVIELPGTGNVRLDEACIFMDTLYDRAMSRTGEKRVSFEKLNEHFFNAEIVRTVTALLEDLDIASTGLKRMQEQLGILQERLKSMPAHVEEGETYFKAMGIQTNTILDSARRDVMAYVRYVHHIKRFVDIVRRMDTELQRANVAAVSVLKNVVAEDSSDKESLNAARKKLEESLTIDV